MVQQLASAVQERDEARAALIAYRGPFTDSSLRQIAAAAYAGGLGDGYRDGYVRAEADQIAAWSVMRRRLHNAAATVLDPDGWEREQVREAARRVRAAEAAEKRDQAEHERAFVARAYATAAHLRTEVQQAAILLYPSPSQTLARRGLGRVACG